MAGPIDLDASTIRPMTDIAYKDDDGNWHAGPDAFGYGGKEKNYPGENEFVSGDYAQRARKQRQHVNAIKQNMRKQDMSESEAREYVNSKFKELKQEREKDEPDDERIDVIQRQLGGSP